MRAGAQIDKVALLIERDYGVLRQIVDQLDFVRLAFFFHVFNGFCSRKLESFQRIVGLRDLFHFFLDLVEVLFAEFVIGIEVVIKSVFDGRSDGQLCVRPEVFDGLRHYV